ncbi:hypothetical protein EVAR_13877_1 [Eumeta japonica]|uniref:Uncharacterized protein n=1 Tax=Eumeta variegata TaxID=151549 RepID=A0A4C1U179_EUMVA|nr:hypothetical protein EVAR_13877_1 [Eumeta japonica]
MRMGLVEREYETGIKTENVMWTGIRNNGEIDRCATTPLVLLLFFFLVMSSKSGTRLKGLGGRDCVASKSLSKAFSHVRVFTQGRVHKVSTAIHFIIDNSIFRPARRHPLSYSANVKEEDRHRAPAGAGAEAPADRHLAADRDPWRPTARPPPTTPKPVAPPGYAACRRRTITIVPSFHSQPFDMIINDSRIICGGRKVTTHFVRDPKALNYIYLLLYFLLEEIEGVRQTFKKKCCKFYPFANKPLHASEFVNVGRCMKTLIDANVERGDEFTKRPKISEHFRVVKTTLGGALLLQ